MRLRNICREPGNASRTALTWGSLVLAALAEPAGASAPVQVQAVERAPSAAVESLWDAADPSGRAEAVADIVAGSVNFESLFAALRNGRPYSADVDRGKVIATRTDGAGTDFPYFTQVPSTYTPERRYPVRVFLHGGVSRPPWDRRTAEWWRSPEQVASEDYIGVFPASWNEQRWWQPSQLDNLREILREVHGTYNTDENRVALVGVSDGGTGAYFVAFRDTTPWASFLPFISHAAVLLNPNVGSSGEMFRTNLTNKPLFIVNGDNDRLYPTASVDPYISDFSAGGVEMVYRPLEGVGHETGWWPAEAERIDEFIAARPREPHPACVSWETEPSHLPVRAHWLQIETLAPTPLDASFARSPLMYGGSPAGRVDGYRVGNEIRLRSSGVSRVRLLLSPDVFEFKAPVRVWWNGLLVHDGAVASDVEVLATWAAKDDDRTMLYGAQLVLGAPQSGQALADHYPPAPGSAECRGI